MRCFMWCAVVCVVMGWSDLPVLKAQGVSLDLNTFAVENYPPTSGFADPNWVISSDGLFAGDSGNSYPTMLIGTPSILNQRITGRIYPGTADGLLPGIGDAGGDDDIFGLALGINQGDVTNPDADFVLIDWKGVDQDFDFADPAGVSDFNNLTSTTTARAGIEISRVHGIPNSDELWGKVDLPGNPDGGVTGLARGSTMGFTGYDRSVGAFHLFEIIYRSTPSGATEILVNVDAVEQFSLRGDFPDGSLGLFENHQNAGAIFADFRLEPLPATGDFNGDGVGNLADYQLLVDNFNTAGTFEQGNMNFDAQVDLKDFIEFRELLQQQGAAAAVPEPATWASLLVGMCGMLAMRRR